MGIDNWSGAAGLAIIKINKIPEGLTQKPKQGCLEIGGTVSEFVNGDGEITSLKKGTRFTIDLGETLLPRHGLLVSFSPLLLDKCSIKGNTFFPRGEKVHLKFVFTVNKELKAEEIDFFLQLTRFS